MKPINYIPPYEYAIGDKVRHQRTQEVLTVCGLEHAISPKHYAYNLVYCTGADGKVEVTAREWELCPAKSKRAVKVRAKRKAK